MTNGPFVTRPFTVKNGAKPPISCEATEPATSKKSSGPTLLFTHGAGGDFTSDAMANFSRGFARRLRIICFNGSMNLKSRTAMFRAIVQDQSLEANSCLGGRSMGARAAVMAATQGTTHLVLSSYPLHTEKETRDAILVAIPPHIKVIFVVGDRDAMCQLDRLESVRKRMQCPTWRIVVEGADHGMTMKPRAHTKEAGELAGDAVARWLGGETDGSKEGKIRWDEDQKRLQWTGWLPTEPTEEKAGEAEQTARSGQRKKQRSSDAPVDSPPQKRRRR